MKKRSTLCTQNRRKKEDYCISNFPVRQSTNIFFFRRWNVHTSVNWVEVNCLNCNCSTRDCLTLLAGNQLLDMYFENCLSSCHFFATVKYKSSNFFLWAVFSFFCQLLDMRRAEAIFVRSSFFELLQFEQLICSQ